MVNYTLTKCDSINHLHHLTDEEFISQYLSLEQSFGSNTDAKLKTLIDNVKTYLTARLDIYPTNVSQKDTSQLTYFKKLMYLLNLFIVNPKKKFFNNTKIDMYVGKGNASTWSGNHWQFIAVNIKRNTFRYDSPIRICIGSYDDMTIEAFDKEANEEVTIYQGAFPVIPSDFITLFFLLFEPLQFFNDDNSLA